MNQEVTTKDPVNEAIEAKKAAWASMGAAIYQTEMQLQAMAQKVLMDVKMPTVIEEVAAAEIKLRELKSSRVEIEGVRKNITSKFDKVTSRLMEAEKSIDPKVEELTKALIGVKKVEQEKQAKNQKANDERAKVKELVVNFVNNKDFEFKSKINNTITKTLTHALGDGNIKPEDLQQFLEVCKGAYDAKKFNMVFPGYSASYLTSEEVGVIIGENLIQNQDYYLNLYRDELDKKFTDYNISYTNKQQALEASQNEEAAKLEALKKEQENKKLAASIETNAVPLESLQTTTHRALKKAFVVDMPETFENAIAIMAAFIANQDKCLAKLNVKKWFAFTPNQAAAAMAKVKCDDNNFAPAGITFKEEDKL